MNTLVESSAYRTQRKNNKNKGETKDEYDSGTNYENLKYENMEIGKDYNFEWIDGWQKRLIKDKIYVEYTLAQNELYQWIQIISPTKKRKFTHYTPVLWREMSYRLGKVKFN